MKLMNRPVTRLISPHRVNHQKYGAMVQLQFHQTYIFIEDKEPADLMHIPILPQQSYTALVHANAKNKRQSYSFSNAALTPSSVHSSITIGTLLGSHPRAAARSPLTC
jgi:hypothetical protein